MFGIVKNKKWFVEEYLFRLPVFDVVVDEVLIDISLVPLETYEIVKFIFHYLSVYMAGIYMSRVFHRVEGYIASKSGHSRGSTVDLTIVCLDEKDKTRELDMGTGFSDAAAISYGKA